MPRKTIKHVTVNDHVRFAIDEYCTTIERLHLNRWKSLGHYGSLPVALEALVTRHWHHVANTPGISTLPQALEAMRDVLNQAQEIAQAN